MTVRENPDKLTLRAEELGTLKAYVNVDHIKKKDGVLSWLMLTGMPSVRRCIKASKEKIGKTCFSYKEISSAVVVRKPLENEGSQGCRRRIPRSDA